MDAPWLVVANYLKGVSEFAGAMTNPKIEEMFALSGSAWVHSDETPWCAAFVGACLRLSGYKSTNSLGARSYLNYGAPLDEPRTGCIVVFWRGDPRDTSRGHVAFFDHVDDDHVYVLGGNQGNMVQIQKYARERVLAFRQPVDVAPMAKSRILRNFIDLTGGSEGEPSAGGAIPLAVPPPPNPMPAPQAVAPVPIAPEPDDEPVRIGVPPSPETLNGSAITGSTVSNFGKVQPIVDKWEGQYMDHPSDPGGATNMGITIHTLSVWRGHQVSKADVQALSRNEAWQIMKAKYYDIVRGDDLPIGVATAVHNAAVLSGPGRAAKWLQQCVQVLGGAVTVDGAIGNQTINAVLQIDGTRLMEQFFARQEAFYRSLATFKVFGNGWMSRLDDVRRFARNLQNASRTVIANVIADEIAFSGHMIAEGPTMKTDTVEQPISKPEFGTILEDPEMRRKLEDLLKSAGQSNGLTPVNAALGPMIGQLLNGNKTTLGTLGLLFTTLMDRMSPIAAPTVDSLQNNVTPFVQPVALVMLLWGLLGKYEKWVYVEGKKP